MRYGMNVFQFSDGGRVHAQLPVWDRSGGEDSIDSYFYDVLDEVVSEGKKFYVVMAVHVGSSAVSSHKIKIFSIDGEALNSNAALIKTKTGIRNELAYEVDFTNEANRTGEMPDHEWAWIDYDAKTKTISIPLISEDGKITSKRIRYRFNGKHFQKI